MPTSRATSACCCRWGWTRGSCRARRRPRSGSGGRHRPGRPRATPRASPSSPPWTTPGKRCWTPPATARTTPPATTRTRRWPTSASTRQSHPNSTATPRLRGDARRSPQKPSPSPRRQWPRLAGSWLSSRPASSRTRRLQTNRQWPRLRVHVAGSWLSSTVVGRTRCDLRPHPLTPSHATPRHATPPHPTHLHPTHPNPTHPTAAGRNGAGRLGRQDVR